MKKLLLLLLFIPLTFACSDDSLKTFEITIDYSNNGDRGTLQQIVLPGYVFELDGNTPNQSVYLDEGLPSGLNDVRATLTYRCSIGGQIISRDVYINFIEDMNVSITFNSFLNCTANISIGYYD